MEWYQLINESEVASPALLIFEKRVDENIQRMIEIAGGPDRLRPHIKTHKLGPILTKQIALGITRFKCATIAEAEMCGFAVAAGALLAMPTVGPNIARLCALAGKFSRTRFSTLVDDAGAIAVLGAAAVSEQVILDVYLDLDCGQHRTGVAPGPKAVELYRLIEATPGLCAAGLHAYDGHIHEPDPVLRKKQCDEAFAPVLALREELLKEGFEVGELIAGGSPTFAFHAAHPDRICSPGTTVLWDFGYGDKFPDLPFQPAAVLLTRVISKPGPNRLCLDLGHKALASENPHPRVRLLELPDAEFVMHSEEHLVIETPRAGEFAIGDTLHGIPRHVCPTVALYSEAVAVVGHTAGDRWPITARARRLTV